MNDTAERPCDVILARLRESGQTQGWLAMRLGIDPPHASRLVRGLVRISPAMAVRLSKALGETPNFWARLQADYDVEQIASDTCDG